MTTDCVGGVWHYSLELCRALGRVGTEVILATMGRTLSQGQRIEASGIENVQLVESGFRVEWMDDPWRDLESAATWLELLEAQFAPDLVHLNQFAHVGLPWSAPVVLVAHSDVLTWWDAVRGGTPPPEWGRYTKLVRHALHSADLVITPTRALLRGLESHYGELTSPRVIYNGRDAERFIGRGKEAFVLSAGRLWDEAKNAQVLADIASDVAWPIKLVGDPVSPSGGRVALRNVEILGPRAPRDMAELFAHASIYALPAKYEPFGLTALEAGLAGCALVLGDIPTLREVWGDAAEFVQPDDRAAWRVTLSRLIADPILRGELARRSRARALEFSSDRMLHEYLAAYAAAAGAPRFVDPESAPSPA